MALIQLSELNSILFYMYQQT